MKEVGIALGLTLFAGLATGIGSVIAFAATRTNYRFLSVATGFSAGVMLYVSFVEIFHKGSAALTAVYGDYWGHWANAGAFFGGMLLIGLIDAFIPTSENPHETRSESETAALHPAALPPGILPARGAEGRPPAPATAADASALREKKLLRMGLFTATAIAIHNFPEGLATFLAALHDPSLGAAIAVAVALHNIPEGISVSVPIYYATGDRKKAFLYSLLSGLAEPVGALIAFAALSALTGGLDSAATMEATGLLFAGVAGIMVYISLDELLPTSRSFGRGHDSLIGLIGGMLVMALSLLMMKK